jgi:hypothetical protein
MYESNFAHGPGWWAVYLALMICAVLAMMGLFLVGVTRSYRRRPRRRPDAGRAGEAPANDRPDAA